MKKLLLVSSKAFGGGGAHVFRKNIEALNGVSDFNLSCFTYFENKNEYIRFNNLNDLNNIYKAEIHSESNWAIAKGLRYIWSYKNQKKISKAIRESKPDIIHIHSYVSLSPSIFYIINKYKKRYNFKVVLTHHNYAFVCPNDSLYNFRTNKICKKCVGNNKKIIFKELCTKGIFINSFIKGIQKGFFNYFQSDTIDFHISPSDFLQNIVLNDNPNLKNKIKTIRNPCIESKNINHNKKRKNKVVYFGSFSEGKNILNLIKGFSLLSREYGIQLVLIGKGDLKDQMHNLINKLGLNDIVFIKDYMDTTSLHNYLNSVKFFILPSKFFENSPVSIIEAYKNGLICLASNIGGMKELIELFGRGYLFNPKSPKSISETIEKAYMNYNLDLIDFKNENHDKLERFTVNSYKKEILELYGSLLQK